MRSLAAGEETSRFTHFSVTTSLVSPGPDVKCLVEATANVVSTSIEFEQLFRRYYARVVRWVHAMGVTGTEAEDVAQDVFLIAHRSFARLHADAAATGWLFGISRRATANHRRARTRERARRQRADEPCELPNPEQSTSRREAASILQRFLAELPEEQQLVFILFELEGLSASEAAEVLGVSTDAVYSRARMARDKLARVVARHQAHRRRADGA
jgi:RNA polymerase sigma-70 factor, ECF subfamily